MKTFKLQYILGCMLTLYLTIYSYLNADKYHVLIQILFGFLFVMIFVCLITDMNEYYIKTDNYGSIQYFDKNNILIAIIYRRGNIDYIKGIGTISLSHLYKLADIRDRFDIYYKKLKDKQL